MIERGGGRTSGLTDWHRMDVNSMWACLQDHDTTNHWKQVAGWRKICDLAQTHLSRLQEYRRGLAEAWPPATSAAAHAYLARLDELIDKVRHTHDAAAINYITLAAATQAISGTRAKLQKIHEEYAAKLQQKQAYEATAADPKAAMGSRVPDRPVTDADLEQLNVQARGIMYGLSNELQQAQVALRQPPSAPPTRLPGVDQHNADIYGGGNLTAPAIPSIVAVPLQSKGMPRVAARSQVAMPAAKPLTPAIGPVLGGTTTTHVNPPPNPATPGATPPSTSPNTGIAFPANPPSGLPKRNDDLVPLRKETGGGSQRPRRAHIASPASPPTASPGTIGSFPTTGVSQPANSGTQPRRINPIGGVIGGGGAGTAPTGGAGSRPSGGRNSPSQGSPPLGGASGISLPGATASPRRPDHHNSEDAATSRRWDPDRPWEVDDGVSPVLRPPNEDGPIDPGPFIGRRR